MLDWREPLAVVVDGSGLAGSLGAWVAILSVCSGGRRQDTGLALRHHPILRAGVSPGEPMVSPTDRIAD